MSFGYFKHEDTQIDLAYSMETKRKKLQREDRYYQVYHFTLDKPYPKGVNYKSFTLFENTHKFYFFSFGQDISEIYRDDELDKLLTEWYNTAANKLGIEEVRNIKLALLLK